jgi:hypothetical protein
VFLGGSGFASLPFGLRGTMDAGAEGVQSTNKFSMTLGRNTAPRSPRLCVNPFSVAPAQAGAYPVYRPSAALSGETR